VGSNNISQHAYAFSVGGSMAATAVTTSMNNAVSVARQSVCERLRFGIETLQPLPPKARKNRGEDQIAVLFGDWMTDAALSLVHGLTTHDQ
jgi:hypothetical protein